MKHLNFLNNLSQKKREKTKTLWLHKLERDENALTKRCKKTEINF